jgi:hypothetical protein
LPDGTSASGKGRICVGKWAQPLRQQHAVPTLAANAKAERLRIDERRKQQQELAEQKRVAEQEHIVALKEEIRLREKRLEHGSR